MCELTQPNIVAEGHLPDDIEKLIGFILHGVVHALDDEIDIPTTYFAEANNQLSVIDPQGLPKPEMVKEAVAAFINSMPTTMVGYVTEAWSLPASVEITDFTSIKTHPAKEAALLVTIETFDGVWMSKTPFIEVNGKKQLPESVMFRKVPDGYVPYPQFVSMLTPQVPAGTVLH